VFGIPTVHEDDALRACRAAVEMRDELDRLNKELEQDWGVTIASRTGLNTGEVIAGDPASGHTLVTGDAVNTAARLQQAAPTGVVLIGELTYRMALDAVEVEPVELIEAKGKADPVAAYRLLSIVPGAAMRARRLVSPLVGREAELRVLEEAFERSATDRECVLATIVGMPGVGKSRLVHELIGSVSNRATVLRGRCLPYGEGITFWPIIEIVRQAAGISEGDSTAEAISRIEALLPEDEDLLVIRERVSAAVGLAEAAGAIQETFWAIRKLFEALAANRPLILVFDDIHWAEPTFLDLVEYVEGWSKDSAILVLCVARSELLEVREGWARAATRPISIALAPLTGERSDHLIRNLLGPASVSDRFRDRITEAAEGNPLFIEEMLGMLIDEERLRQEKGGWVEAGDVTSVPTPPSIQSLLAARIELLPHEERAILQRASVVGRVFWWGAVADLSTQSNQTGIESHLQALVRKGMIRPDESAFAGQDAFRFHHILIRDAAYQSLPSATRADLHERFAEWMERIAGERVDEYEEILGYHLEQACRQRLASTSGSDLASRASRFLASAGRRALDRDDVTAALNLLSRASELDPTDAPEALSIRLFLAEAMQNSGDYRRADETLTDIADRARVIGDPGLEWRAKIRQAWVIGSTTNITLGQITGTAEQAIEVFSELGDDWGLSQCWGLLAWMRFNAGRAGEGQKAATKAASHARSAGDVSAEMWSLVGALGYGVYGPTPVEDLLTMLGDVRERVKGFPGHEANLSLHEAQLESMRGNVEAARAAIAHARSLYRELGNTHGLAEMTDQACGVELDAGDVLAAERERRSGYEAFRSMEAEAYQATWAAWLADLLVQLDRDDEALELAREGEELAGEDDITAQVPSRMASARVLARRGAGVEAERRAREAVQIAESTDWLNLQGDAHMALAEVLRLAGQQGDAAEAAREAVDRYERKGNVVDAAHARAQLENLSASTQS
jgi:tetratricopeptide (TPR) repeat protein